MYLGIFEILLVMLYSVAIFLAGAYFTKEIFYTDEFEETPRYDLPIAPVQTETKKKKDDEDVDSFYQ